MARFCKSCDICQRTIQKGGVTKVSLENMPLIDTPFKRVAVDIVGPTEPRSDKKSRYILTMIDYATRYPEAVALPSIETERVAEALVEMFSRVGIPDEMLTDCGSQFTAEVMKEVSRLLSLQQLMTTPYQPMCNGLVERFHATLKQMLRRMCAERPKDWDKCLLALLFAVREVPQESLGFSPLTKWIKSCLLQGFGTFKMPILMFISILVFRPEGQIWNPVRRDTRIYVRRILNASRISKTQLNSCTISPS